ncbi:MAG TPA: class I SAM-dependent methyltransferase [Coxiellaceae bacterium]|nr:class I SAM-dependent methyltransferase [Coxiellaceae bacterium]
MPKTHFGFQEVDTAEKTPKVAEVFHSVAQRYDLMNDLMSLGLHRLWKRFAIHAGLFRPNQRVLDLAGGTGDLTQLIYPLILPEGEIIMGDINNSMLGIGRDRLLDKGLIKNVHCLQLNAESLPFPANTFDRIIMGFGLRNVTHQGQALHSIHRVLKPGGLAIILEFSKPVLPGLKPLYDAYSFKWLPQLGEWFAEDKASYQYLAESIRMHPSQESLKTMMQQAGFENVQYHNLAGGIVAVHKGYKS